MTINQRGSIVRRRRAGLTTMELAVTIGIASVVFGMILGIFIQSGRVSDRTALDSQARQEALLVAQAVERVLRFRADHDELAISDAHGQPTGGGAGQAAPAAGGSPTTGTIPASMAGLVPPPAATATSATATAVPPAKPAAPDAATSAPASVRALLTTGTAAATRRPGPRTAGPQERYAADELIVYSPGGASGLSALGVAAIRNIPPTSGAPGRVYIERSPLDDPTSATAADAPPVVRSVGTNPDRFHASVSFRYASAFDGLDARWERRAAAGTVPKLVEYTVRVWPRRSGEGPQSFAESRDASGRPRGFQLVSAVALP